MVTGLFDFVPFNHFQLFSNAFSNTYMVFSARQLESLSAMFFLRLTSKCE